MTQASRLATVALALLTVSPAVGAPPPPPGARPPVTGARPGPTPPAAPAGAALPSERALVSPGSVAVFPFEKPPPAPPPLVSAPRDLGDMIAAQIRQGLDDSGKYSATPYYRNSPLVLRAKGQGITPDDINMVVDPQRGVIDQERAMRISAAMGVESAVIGSIEEYRYDPQTHKADVTVTVQWLQVPGATPIKTVGVTASVTGSASDSDTRVAYLAAREVAKRALTEMGVPAAAPRVTTTGSTRTNAKNGGKRAAPAKTNRRQVD